MTETAGIPKIRITCDSTCDLTDALYQQYHIEAIPLGVTLGDTLYHDSVDVSAQDIFSYVGRTGALPKTSAISVGEYLEVFRKYRERGETVIHINISGEFSSCWRNACLAAEELGNVYPVDSRNLSTGSGYLAVEASQMAERGETTAAILAALDEIKARLDISFVLQTLEYLKKGGRCSGVAALGANLLKIRPEIEVIDGKMQVGRKYRGNMEKSITDYIRGRLKDRTDIDLHRIFITHSYVPDAIVQKVTDEVAALQPFEEIIETKAGCTVSSHCGPSCLGIIFQCKKKNP